MEVSVLRHAAHTPVAPTSFFVSHDMESPRSPDIDMSYPLVVTVHTAIALGHAPSPPYSIRRAPCPVYIGRAQSSLISSYRVEAAARQFSASRNSMTD